MIPFLFSLALLQIANATTIKTHSAWNGHPGPALNLDLFYGYEFSPYYVPDGSIGFDQSHSSIIYTPQGAWGQLLDDGEGEGVVQSSTVSQAEAVFEFTGVGIQWFGSVSPKHGIADVWLDGEFHSRIDTYGPRVYRRQRLFGVDHLPYGKHSLQIVNTGSKSSRSRGTAIDVHAFVANPGTQPESAPAANHLLGILSRPIGFKSLNRRQIINQPWSIVEAGDTGVNAMQLAVISPTHAIIIDKVEHNPLSINGHPAWGALYDLRNNKVRPLDMSSNSFCAGGTFLSNGTIVNVGGNPVVRDKTSPVDFGDVNGLQAVRLFHPDLCDSDGNGCEIIESPTRLRLASPRWYSSVLRLEDGSAMILGGSTRGGWMNNATTNNPTIEYYPPKNIHGFNGLPIPSSFLKQTLNSNLFPIAFLLPDGTVFIAANQQAMIYDWKANIERQLPDIPNGVRVTYPMTGTAFLLPFSSSNDYKPTVVICGGSSIDDRRPSYEVSSQETASDQCSRMELTEDGISHGWEVETMPQARVMPDYVQLPNGDIMIVNGAQTGIAGYGNVKNQVGYSNADHPALTPVIYRHDAPSGDRFTTEGMPTSNIARLYHSVATLVPDGRVMVTGSNPNLDRSTTEYATEYRVEWFMPQWMRDSAAGRPVLERVVREDTSSMPHLLYDAEFEMDVDLKGIPKDSIQVALVDLGFATHSLHMNSRLVYLDIIPQSNNGRLKVRTPPNVGIYPPGPGWVYIVTGNEMWSEAKQVILVAGDGSNWHPPEDAAAIENMLRVTELGDSSVVKDAGGEGSER